MHIRFPGAPGCHRLWADSSYDVLTKLDRVQWNVFMAIFSLKWKTFGIRTPKSIFHLEGQFCSIRSFYIIRAFFDLSRSGINRMQNKRSEYVIYRQESTLGLTSSLQKLKSLMIEMA